MPDSLLTEQDKKKIISAISKKDFQKVINILKPLKTNHAGTPKTKDKRFVLKEIIKNFKQSLNAAKDFYTAGKFFCDINEPLCKELGVSLLSRGYDYNKKSAAKYLLKIADDANWEVREYAGGAFAYVLSNNPNFYASLLKWTKHPSENIRRAVVMSALGLRENPSNVTKAFALLTPLMYDGSRYVKKNLGPFVIGSYFGNTYPEQTFKQLHEWIKIDDINVRWNVSMAFNNSFGKKYYSKALETLSLIAYDERKPVRAAVISTLRSLQKIRPSEVKIFISSFSINI